MRNSTPDVLRVIVRWTSAACLTCCALISLGCSGEKPIVLESSQYLSPNSHWAATLENVDNGLGFGLGALYDEVHIQKPETPITIHGDGDPSVVFYIESSNTKEDRPRLHWIDASHLMIEYPGSNKPGRATTRLNGITIEYRTFRQPPSGNDILPTKP